MTHTEFHQTMEQFRNSWKNTHTRIHAQGSCCKYTA